MLVVVNTLIRAPVESGIGIAIVLSGLPFYYVMKKRMGRPVNEEPAPIR
jgi:hypothetical protein